MLCITPRNSCGVTMDVSYSRKMVFVITLKMHRSNIRNTLFFQKEFRRNIITHMAANINYAHRRPFCGPVDENRMFTRTLQIKIDLYLPLKCVQSVTKRYRVQMWRVYKQNVLEDKQTRSQLASFKSYKIKIHTHINT